jgi:pyruvate kinase
VNSEVLFSDGQVSSVVRKVDRKSNIVTVEILNNGALGEKKNMCLPGCVVNLPTINSYDENDILNFGLLHKVDYIAVSFARYRSDIEYIRKILAQKDEAYSKRVRIVSKI